MKIDRSFVMSLGVSKSSAAIVRASIDLAHDLGFSCDQAQRFYMARPMPAPDLEAWLGRQDDREWRLPARARA